MERRSDDVLMSWDLQQHMGSNTGFYYSNPVVDVKTSGMRNKENRRIAKKAKKQAEKLLRRNENVEQLDDK